MNYLNPGSFTPDMDFRKNPLQGAVAGMQMSAMQQLLARSYRDSDQDYEYQKQKMGREAEEQPFKLDVLKGQAAEAQQTQSEVNSGLRTNIKQADLRNKLSDAEAQELKNKITKFQDQGDYMTQVAEEYNTNPYQAVRDGPRWQKTKSEAKERQIDLPDNPDPDFFQGMFQKAAAYQQTRPKMIEKMAELQAQAKLQKELHTMDNASRERIAEKNADSRKQVQDARNEGQLAKAAQSKKLEEMAVKTLEDVASEGVSEKNITRVEQAIEVLTERSLEKDTGYSMQVLQNTMNPEKLIAMREAAKDKVAQRYLGKSYKDYRNKKALADIKGMAPQSGPTKSSDLASKIGKAGDTVETEKGTYVWDEQRHGWAKKK